MDMLKDECKAKGFINMPHAAKNLFCDFQYTRFVASTFYDTPFTLFGFGRPNESETSVHVLTTFVCTSLYKLDLGDRMNQKRPFMC